MGRDMAGASDLATAALDNHSILGLADLDAIGAQARGRGGNAVAFLDAQFLNAEHSCFTIGECGRNGQHRILVDHRCGPVGRHFDASQAA